MKEEADRIEKDKVKLLETKQSLSKSEEVLGWKQVMAKSDQEAADELLNGATTTKLHDAISGSIDLIKYQSGHRDVGCCQTHVSGSHAVTRQNRGERTIIGQTNRHIAGKGYSNEIKWQQREIQGHD